MIPVLTPQQMTEVDRNAPEPFEVLVDRAATKVAMAAVDLLGTTYGRRVVVIAGPGNNGADGRIAAAKLRRRGVRVTVLDALEPLDSQSNSLLSGVGLVIDAAFGTGFRGEFTFPEVSGVPVLAVDIPSGVSGLTGEASGRPPQATATVTFAALKPGLLFGDGRHLSGQVRVVDIGLDATDTKVHLVEESDVATWIPVRNADSHKWKNAVWIFAGSPGMSGAARLSCTAAFRSGAGYVRHTTAPESASSSVVSSRVGSSPMDGTEVVSHPLDLDDWVEAVTTDGHRFGAIVVGPGLGRDVQVSEAVRGLVAVDGPPMVIDGDGLTALGRDASSLIRSRNAATILTPHDGEFEALTGHRPGPDRISEVKQLAADTGATVLLKGPTTTVASPDGSVLLSNSGDQRLATAGTGDVLTGVIAANLASGMDPLRAAASAAFIHGLAGGLGPRRGLIASDVVAALPAAFACLVS